MIELMPAEHTTRSRLVAVGDLNGADDVLWDILRRTRLMNAEGHWTGGRAQFVQLGDLFNRGGGARAALELLLRLRKEAQSAGGGVTVLLGNHEAMTCMGHEAYCTEEEYLSFASETERQAWPEAVEKAMWRLFREHPARGPIEPIEPRLEAWKIAHVPGRKAMRKALGSRGRLGRLIRRLPVVHQSHGLTFAHAGVLPIWAKYGVELLNEELAAQWKKAPSFYRRLPADSLFRSASSPIWDRSLARGGVGARRALLRSLELLGSRRMIIGHTQTSTLRGGRRGRILTRFGSKLVLIDVGLQSGRDTPRAALVVQGRRGYEWSPEGRRLLWED